MKHAAWRDTTDVKARHGTASIVTCERVLFSICGNKYRLIAHINYAFQKVSIRFVGTHKAYDKVDAETI